MVFNTGAALLDAVVLAAVSRESEGTYVYGINVNNDRCWDRMHHCRIGFRSRSKTDQKPDGELIINFDNETL